MNLRPGTGTSRAAFVAVVLIFAAGFAYISFMLGPPNPNSSTGSYVSSFYSPVSSQGLRLEIALNATSVSRGEPIRAMVSLVNTLYRNASIQVNPSAYAAIDSWDASDYFCGLSPVAHIFGFALFQGYYTSVNASMAGQPAMLAPPVAGYSCPNSLYSQAYIQKVEFAPQSDEATLYANSSFSGDFEPQTLKMQLNAYTGACSTSTYEVVGGTEIYDGTTSTYGGSTHLTYSCGGGSALDGYWTLPASGPAYIDSASNETVTDGLKALYSNYFSRLQAMTYTIEAKDVWNQTAFAYFSVKGISLEGFGLCSENCGYPSPYLSGFIYFDGPAPMKSLQLTVNGTGQEAQTFSGYTFTQFVEWYKGGFTNPAVVKGDAYVLLFVATFEDNSTASATTVVVAS